MTKRNHKLFSFMLVFSILGFFFSTFFCLAAYLKYVENQDGAFGTIGLRSYFHCGTGSEDDPYVITRPRHLYNLSHLQALGVFSEQKYFQLGYDLNGDGDLEFYTSDSTSNEYSTVLDMKDYDGNDATSTITSIGSEATPFYGVFEGNGLTIKNLTVDASLEDSGLFGYTASRSLIENFILDEVTIKNDGYSSSLAGLYGSENGLALKKRSTFTVMQSDDSHKVVYGYDKNGNSKINSGMTGDSTNKVSFDIYYPDESADASKYYYKMPSINFDVTEDANDSFTYTLLSSDVFFTKTTAESGEETLTLNEYDKDSTDLTDIFSYFDSYKKENLDESTSQVDIIYPLTLSMTVSLVANYVDTSSICHSKVVAALNISFEKLLENSKFITMYVQPRETQHENNMGLVIGHCDGSCKNVYVHNGYFKMNTNNDNNAVSQNSMTGFIGLIGPSVNNSASTTAKGNIATTGKDVGVLDFTDIYTSIVGENPTFTSTTAGDNTYYTYNAEDDNQYMDYLRYDGSVTDKTRYTDAENSIALIGKKVVKDDEEHNRGLGVFTIATDYAEGGTGSNRYNRIKMSTLVKSKFPSSQGTSQVDLYDASNIFYSTYEYKKENISGIYGNNSNVFSSISKALETPGTVSEYYSAGYHMPEESTVQSMDIYEAYYNYLFRFQLQSDRSSFYFSDLNANSIGGKFLNNYFSHILVDENGDSIPVGSSQFGLMIKNKKKQNITELTTNFKLDNTGEMYVFGQSDDVKDQGTVYSDQTSYVVSNSINFEIKTDYANVTILASNYENDNQVSSKGSMLGVYKLPNNLKIASSGNPPIPCDEKGNILSWNNPDYAMALPANKAISFYEYKSDSIGRIGRKALGANYFDTNEEVTSSNNSSVLVDTSSSDTSYLSNPIFAHTFKLPKGRYCLGSALGSAHVFYICAQGQDEGDISLAANVYSKINLVENMDFIKSATPEDGKPFFSLDRETSVLSTTEDLKKNRLYIIFDSGNVSHFLASSKNNVDKTKFELNMTYDKENSQFVFSKGSDSDLGSISSMVITNYGCLDVDNIGLKNNTTINLFGQTTTEKKITYA